jgi:nicotinamidase-related amidase
MQDASPIHRALLVIDVQDEYVTGNLPIEWPEVQGSVSNIARAMDAAVRHGLPVVVVQNTAPAGAGIFERGTPGWALHAAVASRPRDHYVEKRLPSALSGTDLRGWLQARGIDTITVVGYMTHNCVDATIRQAVHDGLAAEMLEDACGSVPYENRAGRKTAREIHEAFKVVMQSRFAAVATTAEWIAAVERGGVLSRDAILASNRRARESAGAALIP